MRRTVIPAVVLIAFAVIFWIAADSIPKSRLGGSVGADGLPKLLAIALGILSTGLIIQTLLGSSVASRAGSAGQTSSVVWHPHLRAAGMVVIGVGYLVALPYLGYMISVALLLLAVALFNGQKRQLGVLAFAALGAVLFYVFFVHILNVPLPAGRLWSLWT
jgi:putative tricarboxylic transport membrane protein